MVVKVAADSFIGRSSTHVKKLINKAVLSTYSTRRAPHVSFRLVRCRFGLRVYCFVATLRSTLLPEPFLPIRATLKNSKIR